MKTLNKEQWLKEMPELIYTLKYKYNFYFSGFYSTIKKDILDVIKNPKHKHKVVLYNREKRFFLVVYKKGSPDIYTCTEYKNDTNNNRISYFIRKFRKSYKKAEDNYAREEFNNRGV